MKNLIILLFAIPLISFGQANTTGFKGDVVWDYIHAVGSADSIAATSGSTQNQYYKVATGITWRDQYGVTAAADSIKILTAGDYKITCYIAATTSNANDLIRVKLFINGAASPSSLGRLIMESAGTGHYHTHCYTWYRACAVNDYLSVRMTNQTAGRAITVYDFKLLLERVPEN